MLLEVTDVKKRYGGVTAVAGIGFSIARSGVCGLIGPNGAGKTTLFDIIAGRTRADSGRISFDGHDVTGMSAHARARLGLSRTFQECRILEEETCLDNLLFAAQAKPLGPALGRMATFDTRARRIADAKARRLLELIRLTQYADSPAGALSFGQKRLVEIASALMTEPRIVLFDEPASGVNPSLLDELRQFILDRHAEMQTLFFIVEHNMEFLMSICDRLIVMHQGAMLADGTPDEVRASPAVIEAYLG